MRGGLRKPVAERRMVAACAAPPDGLLRVDFIHSASLPEKNQGPRRHHKTTISYQDEPDCLGFRPLWPGCRQSSPTPSRGAVRRFLEFFGAQIRNANTRAAYLRAVGNSPR